MKNLKMQHQYQQNCKQEKMKETKSYKLVINVKMILKLFTFVILMHSMASFAKCSELVAPGTITFNVGHIDVPLNAAVGDVLTTVTATETGGVADGCSLTDADAYSRYTTGSPTGLKYLNVNDIYSTNVPGVGFAICFRSCDSSSNTGWFPFVSNNNVVVGSHLDFGMNYTWYYVLVVTGPVSTGTLESGQYGDIGVDSMSIVKINVTGDLIKSVDCTLDSSNIQVNLGDSQESNANSIGYTFNSQDFNIGLTCDRNANITATLDGTPDLDANDKSVLSLSDPGSTQTASGVGAQIIYNGTPLEIGQPINLMTIEGKTKAALAFTARYYQTREKITAGEANATATINLTYQ
ncbi:fimbrial protein (plasmid) [Enterobacter hormaechei]